MNLQTDLSGKPHQSTVNPVPRQMQHPNMDPDRRFMHQKIFEFLMQRRLQSQEAAPPTKIYELVKRLELGLFQSSQTRDEYLNLETLGNRLQVLIKRLFMSNHNQQLQQANSAPPTGTMIPTPGSSSHVSAPSNFNSGSFVSTGNSHMRPHVELDRRFMVQKILEFLMQRRQHSQEAPPRAKIIDFVKRLELGLFQSSQTRDDYLNLETLGDRLQVLIKQLSMGNHNQQLQQANSSPPIGTMIPIPGFQLPGSSSLTCTSTTDRFLATNHAFAPSTFSSGPELRVKSELVFDLE